jgi:hypothetical protein
MGAAQVQQRGAARPLSTATVGAFPSYVEGLTFAVLEKLAARVPTVACDAPARGRHSGYSTPRCPCRQATSARWRGGLCA